MRWAKWRAGSDAMTEKKESELAAERRRARQEEALKENLKRRKEQARARRQRPSAMGAEDEAPEE